jgi:hypothetical protein
MKTWARLKYTTQRAISRGSGESMMWGVGDSVVEYYTAGKMNKLGLCVGLNKYEIQ